MPPVALARAYKKFAEKLFEKPHFSLLRAGESLLGLGLGFSAAQNP
jgi:hypothetical protein